MKTITTTLLLAFVLVTSFTVKPKDKDANKYVSVSFWQFTSYSDYAGYYFEVINETSEPIELTFTCQQFTDFVTIQPGYSIIKVDNGEWIYNSNMAINIVSFNPHFKLKVTTP